jgi:hypothetical protein
MVLILGVVYAVQKSPIPLGTNLVRVQKGKNRKERRGVIICCCVESFLPLRHERGMRALITS